MGNFVAATLLFIYINRPIWGSEIESKALLYQYTEPEHSFTILSGSRMICRILCKICTLNRLLYLCCYLIPTPILILNILYFVTPCSVTANFRINTYGDTGIFFLKEWLSMHLSCCQRLIETLSFIVAFRVDIFLRWCCQVRTTRLYIYLLQIQSPLPFLLP